MIGYYNQQNAVSNSGTDINVTSSRGQNLSTADHWKVFMIEEQAGEVVWADQKLGEELASAGTCTVHQWEAP